jgi:hypothetical protein
VSTDVIPPEAPTRFDLQLAAVPVTFLAGALVVLVSSVQPHVAGAASAVLSTVALLDGTVCRPPAE